MSEWVESSSFDAILADWTGVRPVIVAPPWVLLEQARGSQEGVLRAQLTCNPIAIACQNDVHKTMKVLMPALHE